MVVFRPDPCGIACLCITYIAVLYADYVVIRHLVMPTLDETLWGAFNVVAFNLILFMLILSHSRAVFSDPGVVPLPTSSLDFSDMHGAGRKTDKDGDSWTVCGKCETYRPPRAHHCRICRRCVRRMDHHCPWINNCVGEYNQRFFIQFLFYVGLCSLYAIVLVIVSWVTQKPPASFQQRHSRIIHSIVLIIESVLFGLFVIAIGCDQMTAICSDETAVEAVQKKGPYRPKRSSMALMREVFGRGPVWTWLLPCNTSHAGMDMGDSYNV